MLGICGTTQLPQLPWLAVGVQQHGDQLAVGSFTPVQGDCSSWGGQSCPRRWHSHMKHCPLAGQVPQAPLQFAGTDQAAFSPRWSADMWDHAHSIGTHSLFLGSSPLKANAWPGMRGCPPECHLIHHLCYSQVRASSKNLCSLASSAGRCCPPQSRLNEPLLPVSCSSQHLLMAASLCRSLSWSGGKELTLQRL